MQHHAAPCSTMQHHAAPSACSSAPLLRGYLRHQVTELLHYVAGADAIAEREALIDETLSELASEFGLTCERLEAPSARAGA